MSFKTRLRESRLASGLTQKDVAALIGVAKSTYAGYETGNSEPDMDKVVRLMTVLEVDANYLFQDDIKKSPAPDESKTDARLNRIVDIYNTINEQGKIQLAVQAETIKSSGMFDKHSNVHSVNKA